MPVFTVTDPSGQQYDVTVPEGATNQDAIDYLIEMQGGQAQAAPSAAGEIADRWFGSMGQAGADLALGGLGMVAGLGARIPAIFYEMIQNGVDPDEALKRTEKIMEYAGSEAMKYRPEVAKGEAAKSIAGEVVEPVSDAFNYLRHAPGKAITYMDPSIDPEKADRAGGFLFDIGAVLGAKVKDLPGLPKGAKPPLVRYEKPRYKLGENGKPEFIGTDTVVSEPGVFGKVRQAELNQAEQFKLGENPPKGGGFKDLVDNLYVRSLKILGREDHPLHSAWRKMEADVQLLRSKYDPVVKRMTEITRGIKDKTLRERATDVLYSNRPERWAGLVNRAYGDKTGSAAWRELQAAFKERWGELSQVHPEAAKISGYYPHEVADVAGLYKEMGKRKDSKFVETMDQLQTDLASGKIDMTQYNKAVHTLLIEKWTPSISAPKSPHANTRRWPSIPKEMRQYYKDPFAALQSYFNETGSTIAERRFLGKGDVPIEDAISGKLLEAANKGEISNRQAEALAELYRIRFSEAAKRPAHAGQQVLKNIGYAGSIGNPLTGALNILDILPSTAKYGVASTLKGVGKALLPKSMRKAANVMDPRDIGMHNVAHEVDFGGILGGFKERAKGLHGVQKAASYTGTALQKILAPVFSNVDRFGKRVVLNAALSKAAKMASRNEKWLTERGYKNWYKTEAEWNSFKDALQRKDVTDIRVREVLVTELFDIQPQAISSMPIRYIQSPNGRIVYMLKTWALRQINMIREAGLKGRRGEQMKLGAAVYASSVIGPAMRDGLLHAFNQKHEVKDIEDYLTQGFWRMAVASKYAGWDKGIKQGKSSVLMGELTDNPGLGLLFALGHDIDQFIEGTDGDWKSARFVPFVGPWLNEGVNKQ